MPLEPATPEDAEVPSASSGAESNGLPELTPEASPHESANNAATRIVARAGDDAAELEPETEDLTGAESQTERSATTIYPGTHPGIRAPGWDQTAVRPRDHDADAPELTPASAPSLESFQDAPRVTGRPAIEPLEETPRSGAAPAILEELNENSESSRRRRSEFIAVNEAAKELARAALQAEIEREEKRAMQSYEPEEGEIPPSPEVAKRFDVILQLGKGGMAVVYLCRDPRRGGKILAVKDIRAEMKPGMKVEQRVEHEVKLLKELDHPGIVKVFDLLKFNRGSAIVMEYIDGLPLDHEIGAGRRITWEFAVRVLREIGKAMQYAHDQGVIHRDIKPDNILYSERHGILKLVDFGLARLYGEEPEIELTRTGMVVGTPHYMSPEQVSGKSLDQRSDMYSFGATLYYLLTGQRHVAGSNVMDILEQQRSRDILPPSHMQRDIPAWLSYIIGKMMEIKPDDRYPDMNAVLGDLDAAQQNPESFLANPPWGPVKRYGAADLAPFSTESEYFGTPPDSPRAPSNQSPGKPDSPTSVASIVRRRTTRPLAPVHSSPEIAVMLHEISTRLERTEKRMVSPGALVLIVMLSTLVIVLLIVGLLLYAAKEGLLERLLYV